MCDAIWDELSPTYLKLPSTEQEWKKISEEFMEEWDHPHVLGALDGRFTIYLSIAVLLFLSIMYYKLNKHTGVNVIYND